MVAVTARRYHADLQRTKIRKGCGSRAAPRMSKSTADPDRTGQVDRVDLSRRTQPDPFGDEKLPPWKRRRRLARATGRPLEKRGIRIARNPYDNTVIFPRNGPDKRWNPEQVRRYGPTPSTDESRARPSSGTRSSTQRKHCVPWRTSPTHGMRHLIGENGGPLFVNLLLPREKNQTRMRPSLSISGS